MIAFFANIFGYLLNFIYNFIQNYGLSIIIFSIIIKILMIPLSIRQHKTLQKSTKIQAKMKEIQFKYKNNPQKLNEATMELYKSENMSPFSGCLSAIVQIILLFSIFYLVRSPLTYMKKVDIAVIDKYTTILQQNNMNSNGAYPEIELINEIENIKNLKNNIQEQSENTEENQNLKEIKEEELDSLYINMDFLGLNLAQIPTKSSDWKAYIIPILYVAVSVIAMKLTNKTNAKQKKDVITDKEQESDKEDEFDPMAQMNKNMSLMFPIMYLAVALIAPLGLALYWLTNSLLMIVEKLILNKFIRNEEEQ